MSATPGLSAILESLNPPQREAVLHPSGPLLVLAGAGSGKTRVITHRIARLFRDGVPPDGVLAITFTNKAAGEMKDRTEKLCGVRSPWVSTFHSFSARILRRHIQRLPPYDSSFSIYDADDSRAILKEILKELRVDAGLWTPRAAQEEVSRLKNSALGVEAATEADFLRGKTLGQIYQSYVEKLRERNALDFDDLLLLLVRLFETAPDVLARYEDQFHHVLVDEFQDTNAIQYRISRLLSGRRRNLCITGDPDQSIYGWRGADISNILNFQEDFPDAKAVTLDKNYRSTASILEVANSLIAHNTLRLPKNLWTDGPCGEPVRVYRFTDDRSEAEEVASLVRQFQEEGMPAGDIAVFYRLNALSRAVEQEFIYANLPYDIVGGIEFFLRREIKDVIAYLRVIDNPRDVESLRRIINVPARGLGKSTQEKLIAAAQSRGVSLLEYLLSFAGGEGREEGFEKAARLGRKATESLGAFASMWRGLAEQRSGPVASLVRRVIEETGYEDHLRDTEGDAAREDLANVWELVRAAEEYDASHEEGSLTGFLEQVNLLGDVDRWERREDRVSLMTLHSAKGLEFPVVILLGLEDGILPLVHAEDAEPDIEEERRLLYVGITRAKKKLYLTHTESRMRFGRIRRAFPSRFLTELCDGPGAERGTSILLDSETREAIEEAAAQDEVFDDHEPRVREDAGLTDPTVQLRDPDEVDADSRPDWEPDEDPYPVGMRVRHDAYGPGRIVRVSGVGPRRRITIRFEDGEEKQFVPGIAPIHRIR